MDRYAYGSRRRDHNRRYVPVVGAYKASDGLQVKSVPAVIERQGERNPAAPAA